MPPQIAQDVPLAPLTTLQLGGHARFFADADSEEALIDCLRWAAARGVPTFVLGGGSNVVVADAGFDGLVIRVTTRGVSFSATAGVAPVFVRAEAGEPWDPLVAQTVTRELAGLECLSGIPGSTGATPIQNVGAYGQEVADSIQAVRVVDRHTLAFVELTAADCAFSYRDSRFKREPERFVVTAVTFALRPGGPPTTRYRELALALETAFPDAPPTLSAVRETVLRLRRTKAMVIDSQPAADANQRSVGSFFTNPILAPEEAQRLVQRLLATGVVTTPTEVPAFAAGGGRTKFGAAWLIERAGFAKGFRRGAVGISSRHALALVHHGGGKTADLLELALEIRRTVLARFGVLLVFEPVLVGVAADGGELP